MKQLKLVLFMFIGVLMLISCVGTETVAPGEEGVYVLRPIFIGSGGVEDDPMSTGRKWMAATTDIIKFNITPQQVEESFDDIITIDNNPVDFSAFIKLKIIKGRTPTLYEKFKLSWYETNLKEQFRASVRGKCSQFPMFVLTTNRSIVDSLEGVINTELTNYVKDIGLPVDILKITIGKVTPPAAVITETIKTAAQKQRIITEESKGNAEVARERTETKRAIADKAYMNSMRLTNDQYIKLREIEMIENKPGAKIIYGGVTPTYPVGN